MRIYGRRRLNVLLCVIIMAMLAVAVLSKGTTEVYGATTYSFTCERGEIDANTDGPNRFTVPALKLTGVCCQYGTPMKKGKAKLTRLSNSSDYAKVAYYWGIKKGYGKKGLNTIERKKLVRMMQHIANPKGTSSLYYVKYGNCKKDIKTARAVKVPDTFFIYKGIPTNGSQNFVAWKNTNPISLTLKKTSTDSALSSLGNYTFKGIKYQVYKSDKKTKVGVLTCKDNGTTNTLTGLVKGTYYAKETATNGYYSLNGAWLKVTVAEGGKGTFKASDTPLRGKVVINKGSTDKRSIGAGYDFRGIVYGVYLSKSTDSQLLAKLTLDTSGKSNTSGNLPVGTRYIREIETNSYYQLSDEWYEVNIKGGKVTSVPATTVMDEPVTGKVLIAKSVKGGEAPDQEFLFDLISRRDSSVAYRDICVKGSGDPVEIDVLAGEYLLRETDSGDLIDETGDQEVTVEPGATVQVERVNRWTTPGSLQVRKITDDGGPRSGFTFIVSGKQRNGVPLTADRLISEADPRVYFTDTTGNYLLDKWNVDEEDLQRINTAIESNLAGDFPVTINTTARPPADEGNVEEQTMEIKAVIGVKLSEVWWDAEDQMYLGKATDKRETEAAGEGYGITFNDFEWCGSATMYKDPNTGEDHTVLVTDSRGYGIDEKTGKEGIILTAPGDYTVREAMTDQQKARYHEPAAQTMSWDGKGKGSLSFTFRNIAKTIPVKMRKTSMDGKVSGIDFCLSGKTAFGDSIRRTGTTDENGNIDFGTLARGNYVMEEIGWDPDKYANNNKLDGYERPAIAFEVTGNETSDIVLEFENIPYAGMGLTKRDKATGHFLPGAEFSVVNVTDNCVEATFRLVEEDGYPKLEMMSNSCGISVGQKKETDAEAKKQDGDPDPDGEWVWVNGLISGKDYRVVETDGPLGYGVSDAPVEFRADHNEDAVVRFEDERSSIGTCAVDADTKDHVSTADDDVTIVDTVTYKNLIPGKEYRLEGILMNRNDYLVSNNVDDIVPARDANGKEIRAEVRFKPEKADGSVKVRFRFDGRGLGGSSLVAYERLFTADGLVTSHEDPTDPDQTIEVPKISTNALAERTGMHIDNASKDVVISDEVTYSNLVKGVEYHLEGVLMDKVTGRPLLVDGEEVRSEKAFTASGSSGSVILTFRFDGRELAGKTTVAFEELRCKGKIVAEHKDIKDPAQTVEIPRIGTVAERTTKNRIEDLVTYSGLIPGKKYVMSGVLVDKKTGMELEETMSQLEFIPDSRDGKVVIRFDLSVNELLGRGIDEVVAFERCDILADREGEGTLIPIEVASHRDIEDENQMVSLREPIKKTHTGDGTRHIWLAFILLVTAVTVGGTAVIRGRSLLGS